MTINCLCRGITKSRALCGRFEYIHTMAKSNVSADSGPGSMVAAPHDQLDKRLGKLSWLLGTWRSETGLAKYPTMKDFSYGEEMEFFHIGQPNIQFKSNSWFFNVKGEKMPLHIEYGFIRCDPGSDRVGLMIAQNLGVSELEEGEVTGTVLKTESHTIGRLSFGKEPAVTKVKREFRCDGKTLEHILWMSTTKTPMTEHLRIKLEKVS